MRSIDARVRLARPDFEKLRVVALDANGKPLVEATGTSGGLALLPGALYYLLSSR
jgi:hypothetical protein